MELVNQSVSYLFINLGLITHEMQWLCLNIFSVF